MIQMTCMLAVNTYKHFFFVNTTTASTHCLVENFQPISWLTVFSQIVKSLSLCYKKSFNMVQPINLILCKMIEIIEQTSLVVQIFFI